MKKVRYFLDILPFAEIIACYQKASTETLPAQYTGHVQQLSKMDIAVSQWPNGNMPDCGVRGPRFESHRRQLCLSWQPLRYTALGTGCTPLLQCLGRLSLPPSVGRQNEYQLSVWVIIKWRWWMWTVAAISFWWTRSPSQLAWSKDWRPPRRWVCIHQMNRVNSRNGFAMITAP